MTQPENRRFVTEDRLAVLQAGVTDQVDFVELVRANSAAYSTFRVSRPQANNYQVRLSDGSSKGVLYAFVKDTDDDFLKLGACYAGYGTNTKDAHLAVSGDLTGTWVTTSSSWYTTTVGGTVTATVKGSTVSVYVLQETRGGLWNYTVKDAGVTVASGTVSCWGASTAIAQVTLATGLTAGTDHVILLTYAGDDPAHTPSSSPSRGYIRNDVWGAFVGSIADASVTNQVLHATSNKEMAFSTSVVDPDSGNNWVPEHNNIASAFQIDAPAFYNDQAVIDPTALPIGTYTDVTKFRLRQHIHGRVIGTDRVEIWTEHTIEANGMLTFSGRLQVINTPVTAMTGYAMMLPGSSLITEFVTGLLHSQLALGDSSTTYFTTERDAVNSGALVSATSPNLIGAGTILNSRLSMRRGKTTGKPTTGQDVSVWHRPTPPKMYWQQMKGLSMAVGDAHAWSFKLMVGEIDNVYGMVKS